MKPVITTSCPRSISEITSFFINLSTSTFKSLLILMAIFWKNFRLASKTFERRGTQSCSQSPQASWSAGGRRERPAADHKARGLWVKGYFTAVLFGLNNRLESVSSQRLERS